MHTLRLAALLPLALGLLAGCQSTAPSAKPPTGTNAAATPAPASTQASAPTSAANPSRPLIAVVDDRTPSTLRLVALDGREGAPTAIPSSGSFSGVGGGMAAFVAEGQLEALRSDGAVVTLGSLQGFDGTSATVSPDGQQWMWSTISTNGSQVSSKLMLGSKSD